ncbi:GNAT family N-acetyltransferase [Rheinheimera aquimaris]|uniref:GNAT family N-acetyltransferase n=1 Tax=Rheinheimera aquimaris TaxID=412437 RepID=A0ABP3ND49_9GAMM|nr:GNAT family N-acetyltransferase [Rheinheimera aquimaris]MCB5212523.1 GNAT family N-acetyltransferase [Rheinheimera aquimaris]
MLQIPATERLHFALLSEQDAPLLFEVDQDAEVMRYINGGKLTSMQTIVEVMLPRMAQYRDAERGYGIWQVRRSADNAYLGWVLIRPTGFKSATPSSDDVEIGWRLKREYWGRGYASEAAGAVAQTVLANNANVQFLSAIAMPDNAGSIGVMRKLGMQYIKRFMHRDVLGDVDAVLYQKKLAQ